MQQKDVVVHAEPEFVTAYALMVRLSHPDGPLRDGLARSYVGHGLDELSGVYEQADHEPAPADGFELDYRDLEDARDQLDAALAGLLGVSASLEDSLRVSRARDWVSAAWDEYAVGGEGV